MLYKTLQQLTTIILYCRPTLGLVPVSNASKRGMKQSTPTPSNLNKQFLNSIMRQYARSLQRVIHRGLHFLYYSNSPLIENGDDYLLILVYAHTRILASHLHSWLDQCFTYTSTLLYQLQEGSLQMCLLLCHSGLHTVVACSLASSDGTSSQHTCIILVVMTTRADYLVRSSLIVLSLCYYLSVLHRFFSFQCSTTIMFFAFTLFAQRTSHFSIKFVIHYVRNRHTLAINE